MPERGYGWDEYCEVGLAELRRIRDSATLVARPGQRKVLNKFIDIYSQGSEEQITGRTFYPEDKECDPSVDKKASKIMRDLKRSIEEYYRKDTGQNSSFRIGFAGDAGRSYLLRVEPAIPAQPPSVPGKRTVPQSGIEYTEVVKKNFVLFPAAWALLCIILGVLGVALGIEALVTSANARAHWVSFLEAIVLLAATVLCLSLMRCSYLVYRSHFGYFIGHYFIKRDGKKNRMAAYTANCPLCSPKERGQVHLTYHRRKGGGYRAECRTNPDQHQFSFDHTSLIGDHVPA